MGEGTVGMYNMQQMIICYGCMQKRMDHKLTNVIEQMTIHLCGHAQGQRQERASNERLKAWSGAIWLSII